LPPLAQLHLRLGLGLGPPLQLRRRWQQAKRPSSRVHPAHQLQARALLAAAQQRPRLQERRLAQRRQQLLAEQYLRLQAWQGPAQVRCLRLEALLLQLRCASSCKTLPAARMKH